ncbi:unnamed protein product, partial [Phaeothamnion confervicola]
MYIYLSKKIAIPNGTRLRTIAWNPDQGWIACGGDSGLMKVLKLEGLPGRAAGSGANPFPKGAAAPSSSGSGAGAAGSSNALGGAGSGGGSNLSMNQTLEGHGGAVVCVTWNAAYSKLTTADENGLIIVWMLHKAMWFEEMINNRNRSVVRDMRWSGDGQRICIVYADGAVIVGGVDGNRLWGKELETPLKAVQWAPDGRSILFTTEAGEVHMYSSGGDHIRQLRLPALEDGYAGSYGRKTVGGGGGGFKRGSSGGGGGKEDDDDDGDGPASGADGAGSYTAGGDAPAAVVAMDWYDGAEGLLHPDVPTLCVVLSDGRMQLSRGADDARPIVLDPCMRIRHCRWNTNGTILAVCGAAAAAAATGGGPANGGGPDGVAGKELAVVKFYSPFGRFLTLLKVPGPGVSSMAWEGGGLRLALAVEAFVYFANVRPSHSFGHMAVAEVAAFAYQQADRNEACVCFWDYRTLERRVKPIKDLRMLLAGGAHAVLVTGPEPDNPPGVRHVVTLYNAVGVEVDSRTIDLEPVFGAMTATHVAVSDRRHCYV